jgi:hypothetical protein
MIESQTGDGNAQNAPWHRLGKLWQAVVAPGAGAFLAVAVAAFACGRTYEESQANVKIAGLMGAAEVVQAKLVAEQAKNSQLSDAYAKLGRERNQALEILNARNGQIERLSARVGSVNNCAFVHEQIRMLERELRLVGTGFVLLGESRGDSEAKQRADRAAIDQRIAGYQAQLGEVCK